MKPYELIPTKYSRWKSFKREIRGVKKPVTSLGIYKSECIRGNGCRRVHDRSLVINELKNYYMDKSILDKLNLNKIAEEIVEGYCLMEDTWFYEEEQIIDDSTTVSFSFEYWLSVDNGDDNGLTENEGDIYFTVGDIDCYCNYIKWKSHERSQEICDLVNNSLVDYVKKELIKRW